MDLWFYITIIVGLSLLYYGYENKKKYDIKLKQIELEEKKLDLEMIKIEAGLVNQDRNE
ncbi:hypothetical protein [Bacillus sp. FJAT-27225]|uniref:hypothetical protein n=1 Tax=Bacillus sp. FJAT-27225 TaxID=1743144 RepID=UPI0015864938|nr:hypothetical protein [Bacillus sp. FJAT-27225]